MMSDAVNLLGPGGGSPIMRMLTATSDTRSQRARDEFDRFVADSAQPLLRTAYLISWDLAEAEDLVQECLMLIARRWPRVRAMDHPRAYARRVLINRALDGAGGRSRRRQELDACAQDDLGRHVAPDRTELVGLRSELVQALGALPARQRTVLVLRYFEDLSEAQVAAALGCSLGTVKSTASRALARLQPLVERPDLPTTAKERTP